MKTVAFIVALAATVLANPLPTPVAEPMPDLAMSPRAPQLTPDPSFGLEPIMTTNSAGDFRFGGTGSAQLNSELAGNIAGAYKSGSGSQGLAGHAAGTAGPFAGTIGGEGGVNTFGPTFAGCIGGQAPGAGQTVCFPVDTTHTPVPGDIS